MSKVSDMFLDKNLVARELSAESDIDALKQLSALMIKEGVAKESFTSAILEREKIFPTGLPMEDIGVAIPHTDAEHVIKQSISIGILQEPVEFRVMGGDEGEFVKVKIIFMLAIKNPQKQVEFLQALVDLIQKEGAIEKLVNLHSNSEIVETFNSLIED